MKHVVVCPGHYSEYKGVNKNNYYEFDEVVKIVDHIVSELDGKLKVTVFNGKLIDKVNSINALEDKPDFAVEVHLGNTNNSKTSGSRAFFMKDNAESDKLASVLLNRCIEELGTEDRGCWIGWYKKISPTMVASGKAPTPDWKAKIDLFLSKSQCPSAIIEPFYISSISDCDKFIKTDSHYIVAKAIANAILDYSNSTS